MYVIYYDDGSSIASETPDAASPFGVIVIVQWQPEGKRYFSVGSDFYFWNAGQWLGCDIYGVIDRMLHRLPTEFLLLGRLVPNDTYQAILKKADAENR